MVDENRVDEVIIEEDGSFGGNELSNMGEEVKLLVDLVG